jgi:hypothetical protein
MEEVSVRVEIYVLEVVRMEVISALMHQLYQQLKQQKI